MAAKVTNRLDKTPESEQETAAPATDATPESEQETAAPTPTKREAADARAAAAGTKPVKVQQMLAALAVERVGYVSRGLDDRVAAVDEQIELWSKRA